MYSYMGQSRKTFLIFVFITTLFTGCYGTISSITQTNWTDAHTHCMKEGKMLPNLGIHTLFHETYFWTGHYIRLSGWIKIIGCFEETAVNTLKQESYEMHFPSAGLCQEACLESNYFVFGVQLQKCVCLEQIPKQRSRGANDCSLSCSAITNLKFRNDCGGNKTYSLFKSGSDMANSRFATKDCLSIQCPKGDQKFIESECNTKNAQICSTTWYAVYTDWQSSSAECKSTSKQNSYLFGDVNLTDPMQACNLIRNNFSSPSWIGIAKELYISSDGVIGDMVHIEKNPMRCLKCKSDNCTLADCKESNSFVCLEGPDTTSTIPTGTSTSTTPHGTVYDSTTHTGSTTSIITPHGTYFTSTIHTGTSTSTTQHETVVTSTSPNGTNTSSTEHSTIPISEALVDATGSIYNTKDSIIKNQDGNTTVIMVVVPVTVIVVLGLIALLVILWRRRKNKKTAETKHAQHEPSSPQHSEESDTNQSLQNNYFVLDKTETYSVVNSNNHAKDKGSKIPNKECSEDDYDHLGENVREEVEEEDNYHHAFFPSNENEPDYGTCIRNMSAECLMENPYSHTNTRGHHVTLEDNEYNTISINA